MRRQLSKRYIPSRYLTSQKTAVISVNPEVNRLFVRTEDKKVIDNALEEQKDKLKRFEEPEVEVITEDKNAKAAEVIAAVEVAPVAVESEPEVVESKEPEVVTEDKTETVEEAVEPAATEDKTEEPEVKESAYAKRKKAKQENKK